MIKLLSLSVLLLVLPQQQQEYEYVKGIPSSKGITDYIKRNEYDLIEEFKKYAEDTILEYYDVYIETDDLSLYSEHDTLELGRYYLPGDVIVTDEQLFVDYELDMVSKYRRRQYQECNRFVKSTVMHELMHWYFYVILLEMRQNKVNIEPEYTANFRMMPYTAQGAEFIEEGVCEYASMDMGQMIVYNKAWKPKDVREVIDRKNSYDIKYRYSLQFVKAILDTAGLKKGVMILVSVKPPSNEEILHPEMFYQRINGR